MKEPRLKITRKKYNGESTVISIRLLFIEFSLDHLEIIENEEDPKGIT